MCSSLTTRVRLKIKKKINLINLTLSLVKTLKVLYVQNFLWWKYTIFPVYPKNLGIYHSFHKKNDHIAEYGK